MNAFIYILNFSVAAKTIFHTIFIVWKPEVEAAAVLHVKLLKRSIFMGSAHKFSN